MSHVLPLDRSLYSVGTFAFHGAYGWSRVTQVLADHLREIEWSSDDMTTVDVATVHVSELSAPKLSDFDERPQSPVTRKVLAFSK